MKAVWFCFLAAMLTLGAADIAAQGNSEDRLTVIGCVQWDGDQERMKIEDFRAGSYWLAADPDLAGPGELMGEEALRIHLGHQIEVVGPVDGNTLTVETVRYLSRTCWE